MPQLERNAGKQNSPRSKLVFPRAVSWGYVIPAINCRSANLNGIYNRNICEVKYQVSSISGCTSTGDLPGANTYSQNGSKWERRSPKCIGYLDGSKTSPQSIEFSYTKQFLNQSGPMEYNCGVRLPLQT
jgi:hypothetical protein